MAIVNRDALPKKFLKGKDDIIYGRVLDIILGPNHPDFHNYDDIGTIFFHHDKGKVYRRKTANSNLNSINNYPKAKPLHPNSRYIPLKNEIVALYKGIGIGERETMYYSSVLNIWNSSHHNALPARGELPSLKKEEGQEESQPINLGAYYTENDKMKPLIPFEGDFLLEGRFGNSIRFGSTNSSETIPIKNHWSNGEVTTGDPITIIRNGQAGMRVPDNEKDDVPGFYPTIEDPNRDDSSIYMTSNQVITDLKVAGLTDSEEPWIISWPSFGSEDIEQVENQVPFEADQTGNDDTEDMTDEELNQAAAGEDEIAQPPTDVDNPEEDDIIYFDQLPDTDEEAENAKLRQFVDYLFGPECFLSILAGSNQIYEIFERMAGGSKYYYPDARNSSTNTITKDKLYEILVYYDVKISHHPNNMLKSAKKPLKIGWLNSPNYFRSHVDPFTNTLHIPSIESLMFIFDTNPAGNPHTQMEAARTIVMDCVWKELSHIANIDKNGFFGYVKDDWENLSMGIIELIGKREKNENVPRGMLIPKNSMYLKEDMRGIEIRVDETSTNAGTKVEIDVKNIPGNLGSEKLELEFKNGVSRPEMEKRMTEVTSNMLREDHKINLRLIYSDATIVNIANYDNITHHDTNSQAVETQLASEWLQDHDGRAECGENRVIHVSAMTKEDAEKAYEKEIETQGETSTSKKPKKYQNTQTGVFSFRSEVWKEVMDMANSQKEANRKDNTDLSGGNAGFGGG